MNAATDRIQTWPCTVSWVKSITYRLSKTGASVFIQVTGNMHPKSKMPGGTYYQYIPASAFAADPIGKLRAATWNALAKVKVRYDGSLIVWAFRDLDPGKELLQEMSKRIWKRGSIYTSEKSQRLANKFLNLLVKS